MKNMLILLTLLSVIMPKESNVEITETQPKDIHSSWDMLLKKYVSDKGNVNYADWKKDVAPLESYIALLEKNIPNSNWSKNDSLAYFINAYNAITVKLILDNYPIKSIKDIKDPWDGISLKLPSKSLTLNQIEHEVLRKMGEPRIHFAVNCASFSCPKLLNGAFLAETMETQLNEATTYFINDKAKNKFEGKKAAVSKIFLWFSKDFGDKNEHIAFFQKYSKTPIDDNVKIDYLEYGWSLNE